MKFVQGADAKPYVGRRLNGIWPEFLLHDKISNRYWDRLYEDYADFQFFLVDGDEILAEGNCLPVAGQPTHWRDAFLAAFERGGKPDHVCALAIIVSPTQRGRNLSESMLEHMRGLAAPFGPLVAPVRPTLKARYPLIPIEQYVSWRREDGLHFDPWIRIHERVGGQVTGPAEEAMLVEAPVSSWQEWTGVDFPGDGEYVVPGALVPVSVRDGHGTYREPCVWIRHRL
jgi:GNAT superfamily N-acetyltransferase